MPNVMDMHREMVRMLGGYALTDKDRVATLHEALRLIADDCLTSEASEAALLRIRRVAVAAVHATTHIKDPFPETATGGQTGEAGPG
ncbi:hypothetical protein [Lichenicoccus roseus]|uniref:Uncharacterized protein n=1 Tax=Lichenicoccus roseus TaxID=2683649 RepID=A0A5R9J7K5_9PROT|nr:hypothetical protein [Lichenicoccus roseus]TLU73552.1 hypothetical protein FE263_09295 [Lichenicoccus roseus]